MDWIETAKRLTAHPKWEWREGMLVAEPRYGNTTFRLWKRDKKYWHGSVEAGPWYRVTHEEMAKCFPVLTDWPTVGVMMGMVAEAGEPLIFTAFTEKRTGAFECHVGNFDTVYKVGGPGIPPGQAVGEHWLALNP